LIDILNPKKIIFLGDIFHSDYNDELKLLVQLTSKYLEIEFIVVRGNHDILPREKYIQARLRLVEGFIKIQGITFAHDYQEHDLMQHSYIISGHIHPGIKLTGKARQVLVLPCFYFTEQYAILPAFGSLTGLYPLKINTESDFVYAILENHVVAVPNKFRTSK
jgi:metallophosphoesterase superfamily enzyme